MSELPNDQNEAKRQDALAGEEDEKKVPVEEARIVVRPGMQWQKAASRRGLDDEYENRLRAKYGEDW